MRSASRAISVRAPAARAASINLSSSRSRQTCSRSFTGVTHAAEDRTASSQGSISVSNFSRALTSRSTRSYSTKIASETTGQIKPRNHASTQACGSCRQNTPATNTPVSSPTSFTGGLWKGLFHDGGGLFRRVTARRRPRQQPFHFRRRRRPHRAHQQSRFAEIEHIERPAFGQTFALTPFQRKHGLPFGRQSHRRGFHGSKIILPKATRQFDPRQAGCPPAPQPRWLCSSRFRCGAAPAIAKAAGRATGRQES